LLLKNLQKKFSMAMIFITHNVALLKDLADRTLVLYAGQVAEEAATEDILSSPRHPYTQGLLKCLPRLTKNPDRLFTVEGQPPLIGQIPPGCPFHPRCPKVMPVCTTIEPPETVIGNRRDRCHLEAPQ
jgi:oligopeptide/dipeptide ABC transporter ATP-binding protein